MLMWKGRLLGDPAEEAGVPLPRPELIPVIRAEIQAALEHSDDPTLPRSYQAFLMDALVLRVELGQLEEAAGLYRELADLTDEFPSGDEAFRAWAGNMIQQDPAGLRPDHALLRVVATLLRARAYEEIDSVRATGLRGIARQVHRLYQESRETPEHLARTGLPSFDRIRELLSAPPES
jgi:hypothetical protein